MAYSGSHRVTGTPRASLSGEGALYLPPQALFHTHLFLFPAPGFFCKRWPSGPRMDCQTLPDPMPNSERCSKNTPELHVDSMNLRPLRPPPSPANFGRFRGKCCAFFSGAVFWEIPLIVLGFFTVLLFLGFLCGGFSVTNSCAGAGREESRSFVYGK